MPFRIKTLLAMTYGVLAAIVTLMVFWSGSQYQKTEKLIAELNEGGQSATNRDVRDASPRRSLRPSLVRLQQMLEERTRIVREQEDQLSLQISGRQELEQKFEKLSAAYDELSNEHQLLLTEIEFFLGASSVVGWNPAVGATDETQSGAKDPTESSDIGILATEQSSDSPDPDLTEADIAELATMEVAELQDEVARLNLAVQRDSLIAGYASHAMVEMGPSAVPLLVEVLSDDQANARAWAAWVLGQIGPEAGAAIPELQEMLEDDNAAVVQSAAEALRRIAE